MITNLANFFLKFGHITFILPTVLLGMIFHKRELYAKAICLLFFIMIWNTLLKQLFKVPLLEHLGAGYAFPSGHMHAAAIFYGYLLYRINNKIIKLLLVILIMCIGLSLVHCRFHNMPDVLGAIGFSILEIFIYLFISSIFEEKYMSVIAIICALVIMSILFIIHKIAPHVWLAFYSLSGMIFAVFAIDDRQPKLLSQKFLSLLISIFLISSIYIIFKTINFNQSFISEIKFALLPVVIMWSINICSRLR